jgi:hypothetical protein
MTPTDVTISPAGTTLLYSAEVTTMARMARTQRPLDPSTGPVAAFAADLRKLRAEAGDPKYLQMARRSGRSRTALAEAAGGDHLPTWETVHAFVTACGADPTDWLPRWEKVKDQLRETAVVMAAGPAAPAPPGPPGSSDDAQLPALPSPAATAAGDHSHSTLRPRPRLNQVLGARLGRPPRVITVLFTGLGLVALGTVLPVPTSPTARELQTVVLPAGSGTVVAFSPFGYFAAGSLVTGGPGPRAVVRDGNAGRGLRTINTADDRLTVLTTDPLNRNIMATGGTVGVVRFWDTSTGRPTNSIRVQPAGPPLTLAYNGRRRGILAAGGATGIVTVWDSKNDQIWKLPTALGDVTALAFDPFNEPFLAVGGRAGAELWDIDSRKRLHAFQQVAGTVTALAFEPLTRNTLAIATTEGPAGIWDSSNGASVRPLGDSVGVTTLDFNPMIRNSLAGGDARGRVRIWDTSNGLIIHPLATSGRRITGLDYAMNGETLAVAGDDSVVRLYAIQDW